MRRDVEIQNLTSSSIERGFIKAVVLETLKTSEIKGNIKIGVIFLGPRKIQEVNRKYRNIDKPTDVLSVSYEKENGYLGEILICMSEVRKKAKEYGNTPDKELAHILAHATLHLLGWEHGKNKKTLEEMHAREEEIMAKVL